MNGFDKPPFGVKPAYVCGKERIQELADAISRAARAEVNVPEGNIRLWAREIILQLDMLVQIRILEDER